jgi:hypothetical protein
VILRILAQESPDSELQLERYERRSLKGKTRILEACRGILENIECVEGFFVKRYGYNWNFVGTQGWKCKIVAEK